MEIPPLTQFEKAEGLRKCGLLDQDEVRRRFEFGNRPKPSNTRLLGSYEELKFKRDRIGAAIEAVRALDVLDEVGRPETMERIDSLWKAYFELETRMKALEPDQPEGP